MAQLKVSIVSGDIIFDANGNQFGVDSVRYENSILTFLKLNDGINSFIANPKADYYDYINNSLKHKLMDTYTKKLEYLASL